MKHRFVINTLFMLIIASSITSVDAAQQGKKARITGGGVIDSAAKAWETIYDYQTVLYQVERDQDGNQNEFWSRVFLISPTKEKPDLTPMFKLEFYDHKIPSNPSDEIKDATPVKVYFSDKDGRFYTWTPKSNSVIIEWMNDRTGPIPEFFYLAGFLDFDIKDFKEKAYIHKDAYIEEVLGNETYRVRINPKRNTRGVEPPRELWIDRESRMPKKFRVVSSPDVQVFFGDSLTNQGLDTQKLIPKIPTKNLFIDDKTKNP